MEPIVLTETEGESYDAGAIRMRLLAQAPDQPIAVTESTVPPGFPGPVRHSHSQMTDVFYVLEGELTFDLEGEQRTLGAGSFGLVPPGVAHTFANRGSAPARVLNILQPAGLGAAIDVGVRAPSTRLVGATHGGQVLAMSQPKMGTSSGTQVPPQWRSLMPKLTALQAPVPHGPANRCAHS
jgi:quercetin dioxygenase-like cupin family protein